MQVGSAVRFGLVAAALTAGCATVDRSNDWVDIKDPGELRAIFADKTIKGHLTYDFSRPYTLYSKADGTGTVHIDGRQIDMTWRVNGADQVCLRWAGASPCLNYQRHKTRAGIYRSYNPVTRQYGNDMTVTEGGRKS